ncbi:hypothetical protein OG320_13685 [Microbispora sp. NBC_01189]|uniref:hypothetical protein n=1 Tax=Microbispora sp. NBC_01189 TaxID=2903583 RepID=UPI002E14169A|nr:hypothetical protein OG320_13685 [Microbispora sp. NBC_01189]
MGSTSLRLTWEQGERGHVHGTNYREVTDVFYLFGCVAPASAEGTEECGQTIRTEFWLL